MSSNVVVTNFRVFDLPWTPSVEEERRFRRVLGAALGLFIGFSVVIPFLPDTPRTPAMAPAVPERIVEFILEQPKPKPKPIEVVPPKPVEVPQVEARVERPVPVPVVKSEPKPDPRKKAAASGLLAMSDQLAELRDLDVKPNVDARSLNAGAGERTRVDRSILTAKVGSGSGAPRCSTQVPTDIGEWGYFGENRSVANSRKEAKRVKGVTHVGVLGSGRDEDGGVTRQTSE